MKNLKKIVSVIVMVAMLISSFSAVSVFAADYADVNADNNESPDLALLIYSFADMFLR